MTANQFPVLIVSQTEHHPLTELAHQRGYDDPDEDIRIKFKRAFKDALNDDVLSEEEFWKEVSEDIL